MCKSLVKCLQIYPNNLNSSEVGISFLNLFANVIDTLREHIIVDGQRIALANVLSVRIVF